ncbi:MAG: hypothetical protein HN742_35880 [Lentisphaerae bacterium]|nr:hypothetical protein [Lentisphaerota bacterium]MBT7847305.1 hypothetical protein [Lentisphaerota bacterium]
MLKKDGKTQLQSVAAIAALVSVACLSICRRGTAEETRTAMDSSFFEGGFAGEVSPPEPPVEERVTMVDGTLPEDRDPSFWTLYEKDWYKYVSEKDVFNALLQRSDRNGRKTWEIGIGKGGQLYSWRGRWGEAIAPQAAPWMDEVWQATVHCPHVQKILRAIYEHDDDQCNATNSVGQAFVHGSGCSNKYGAAGDAPYTMFFCPMLARWYDDEDKSYAVINWGQSSTQPTIFRHRILYYSRYRYLGDGVLEVSNVVYNFGEYDYGYNGTPWGGVRATTFPEIFWSNADSSYFFNDKLIRFGHDGSYRPPKETDGWLGAAARKNDPHSPAFGFAFGRDAGSCCVGSAGHGPPRDYIVMASNPAGFSPKTTLSKGKSFWVRYYVMVGTFEEVLRNARAYAEKAGWGDLNIPEEDASTHPLYRTTLADGTIGLTRRASEGVEPVCRVYNEPVLGATPLFVIRELPAGRGIVTTDPYALSRTAPYPNPLPKDHEHHAELRGAIKRYTYESDARKKLGWELLGFVMPTSKPGRDQDSCVQLNTIIDAPGVNGMLALAPSVSGKPLDGGRARDKGTVAPQVPRYRYGEKK